MFDILQKIPDQFLNVLVVGLLTGSFYFIKRMLNKNDKDNKEIKDTLTALVLQDEQQLSKLKMEFQREISEHCIDNEKVKSALEKDIARLEENHDGIGKILDKQGSLLEKHEARIGQIENKLSIIKYRG